MYSRTGSSIPNPKFVSFSAILYKSIGYYEISTMKRYFSFDYCFMTAVAVVRRERAEPQPTNGDQFTVLQGFLQSP